MTQVRCTMGNRHKNKNLQTKTPKKILLIQHRRCGEENNQGTSQHRVSRWSSTTRFTSALRDQARGSAGRRSLASYKLLSFRVPLHHFQEITSLYGHTDHSMKKQTTSIVFVRLHKYFGKRWMIWGSLVECAALPKSKTKMNPYLFCFHLNIPHRIHMLTPFFFLYPLKPKGSRQSKEGRNCRDLAVLRRGVCLCSCFLSAQTQMRGV